MARATILDTQGNARGYLELVPQGVGSDALVELNAAEAGALGEAEVQLLEGARYEYELSDKIWQLLPTSWGASTDVVLQSKLPERQHCGVLNPGLATGTLNLTVQEATGQIVGLVRLEVRSRKLGYRTDYQLMLNDITEQCVGLLQDWKGPTDFKAVPDANADEATLGQQFAFVRALLNTPSFEHALQRVASHPHETWTQEDVAQPIVRGFKPSGKLLRQLASGSRRMAVPTNHSIHAVLPTLPERISVRHNSRTTDTPENRFVKFALRCFRQFLAEMRSKEVLQIARHERLRKELDTLTDKLDQALGCDALRHAGEPTFLPLGSPTLQRREGYRQVLQAWTQFAMAAKLVWQGGENVYGMGQRDVATLYEYWVFFELLRTVRDVFKLELPDIHKLIAPTGDGFGLMLKSGRHLPLMGTSKQPGRELEVRFSYNRTFSSNKTHSQTGSWTKNMRPDYTLSLWPAGFNEQEAEEQELIVHVHFDAKYRLEQAAELLSLTEDKNSTNLTDEDPGQDTLKQEETSGTYKRADLLKMHAYRDAIRRSHGAYVIYPGEKQDGQPFQGFHEVLPGLGAFPLRPGNGTDALQNFLKDVVQHVCNRASARERQSFEVYRTYQNQAPHLAQEEQLKYRFVPEKMGAVRHAPPKDTHVLIGWYTSSEHLEWIRQKKVYNFRLGSVRGGLQLTPKIMGAHYLLLHGAGRKVLPGLFRVRAPEDGPKLVSRGDLIDMGYPKTPSSDTYALFSIEPLLEFEGFEWDLGGLSGLPSNVFKGFPFATNLADLLLVGSHR
jgi:predicted component of viral defense system (DUF524 family)